jgi:hypothetical protein
VLGREGSAILVAVRDPAAIHSQARVSSKSRSATPAIRARARPSSSASSQRVGSSTARIGRPSSAIENLASGNSSFQRSSER